MYNKDKTHCKNGHEFVEGSIRFKNGKPYRFCCACARINRRRRDGHPNDCPDAFPSGEAMRRKTCCIRGHEYTPENTRIETYTRHGKVRTRRRCSQCDREGYMRRTPPEHRVRLLLMSVNEGLTVNKSMMKGARIINHQQWRALRFHAPKLALKIKRLSHKNDILQRVEMNQSKKVCHPASSRYSDAEIMALVNSIVPHGMNYDDRQDIIQRMVLAYLEGSLSINKMKSRWQEFRAAHTKFLNPKFNPLAHRTQRHLPMLSMESTMLFAGEGDGVALGTMISQGMWQGSLTPEDILVQKEAEL